MREAQAEHGRPKAAPLIFLATLFSLLLLTISSAAASSTQNPGASSSPSPGVLDESTFFPQPNWSGEFEWALTGLASTGSYSGSGSGSFTFTVTPSPIADQWNVTGSGTAMEQWEAKGNQGYCSGSGSGSFSFTLSGVYYTENDNFSIGYNLGSFTPQNFTFPMTPNCFPATQDFEIVPNGFLLKAEDGSTAQCTDPSSCAGGGYKTGLTYKITIHGTTLTSTSTTTTSTSSSCTSNADQKLIFYVEKDGFPSGHGFMQFQTDSGPQAGQTDLVYGHGSQGGAFNEGFTRGPGAPQHGILESDHAWDWRIVFHVNPCQYNIAAAIVDGEIDSPSVYSLTGLNCVDWIKMIAGAVGLQLPASTDFLGVSDPQTLANSMANIGNGGTFDNGVVQQNTGDTTPNGTPDPAGPVDPLLASPVDLLTYALQNTSALAASQNETLQQSTLQPVQLGAGGSLNLVLQNVPADATITAMDFGDGSQNVTSSLQYSHVYGSAGTFHARAVIISENLTMYQASFDVTVAAAAAASPRLAPAATATSSANVTITVPNPPPQTTHASTSRVLAERVDLIGANATSGQVTGVTGVGGSSSTGAVTTTTAPSSPSSSLLYYVAGGVVLVVIVVVVAVLVFVSRGKTHSRGANVTGSNQ